MKLFSDEELEELRRADEELDESFHLTPEDMARSRRLYKEAKLDRLDNKGKRSAAQKAAYREANREKYNAYMREYMKKKKSRLPVCETGKRQDKI